MAVSEAQSNLDSHHTPHKRLPWDERDRPREALPRLSRRRSLCTPFGSTTDALISQMAHTFNYPGWKPNLRSHSVHGPFLTLEELFRTLPEGAALHIELSASNSPLILPLTYLPANSH
jgi:glycerophosphodiester phosphodiesterase